MTIRHFRLKILALTLIVLSGAGLANSGWQSTLLARDLVPQAIRARALVEQGQLPDRGTLTSFASFTPPGTTWLLALGVAVSHDVRLVQIPGAVLLYTFACIGVFLLTQRLFDVKIAFLAVMLFAFSDAGLFYASSLWQRAHPAFYVWMSYFALLWAERRDGRYLAAALLVYAAGMYVFLELAPAILVIAVVWIWRRPPISFRPLLIAGAMAFLLWLPYLRFESTRGFLDLQSQIQRIDILPTNARAAYCDPNTVFVQGPSGQGPGDLMVVALIVTVVLAVMQRRRLSSWFFLLPLALLCLMAGFARQERYWWLWALQSVVIAGILYRRSPQSQCIVGFLLIVLIAVLPIGTGMTVQYQFARITQDGITGEARGVLAHVEQLGEQLQSEHVSAAAIAYHGPTDTYPANYHAVDPHYKVGMEYDLLLSWTYGVTNTLTCAEGIAPNATYVVSD